MHLLALSGVHPHITGTHIEIRLLLQEGSYDNRPYSFQVYAPSRTVAVYAPAQFANAKADEDPLGVPGLGVKDRGPSFER